MEGQQKGKRPPMRQPSIPMQPIPIPPNNNSRNSRSYETGSPPWPMPPASSTPSPPPPRPKPAELIERYEAQGMAREVASEKVIEDLQAALQRSLYPMQRLVSLEKTFRSTSAQFEAAAERMVVLESKLDSKPNVAQVFAAGVAAGVFLQTAVKATPPVLAALNDVVGNIKRTFQR